MDIMIGTLDWITQYMTDKQIETVVRIARANIGNRYHRSTRFMFIPVIRYANGALLGTVVNARISWTMTDTLWLLDGTGTLSELVTAGRYPSIDDSYRGQVKTLLHAQYCPDLLSLVGAYLYAIDNTVVFDCDIHKPYIVSIAKRLQETVSSRNLIRVDAATVAFATRNYTGG